VSYYPYSQPVPPPVAQVPPPEVASKAARVPGTTVATACFVLVLVLFNAWAITGERVFNLKAIWVTAVGEVAIVAAVPIIFTLLGKYNFKQVFSLRPISPTIIALCVLVGLAAQFAARLPSLLSNWLLQFFGPLYLPDQFDDSSLLGRIITLVALVVLAPLCEETLNRGFVMAGYRRLGFWRCILLVGLFFGFFHQYPYRLLDTTFAGIILAYLALTTGSIYASIAGHFGFNAFPAVVSLFQESLKQLQRESDPSINPDLLYITGQTLLVGLFVSLFGAALVFLLLRVITRRTALVRPGLVIGYSGLATDIVDGATSYQNGPYYGPVNQPYAYTATGYQPVAAPFPLQPRPAQESLPPPRRRLVTAGWLLTIVVLLALFGFNSFTEFLLRAKGSQYCTTHPAACSPTAQLEPAHNFTVVSHPHLLDR